ncbi:MAG: hypothetical protein Q8O57_09880, partial [Kiritimatiellota bacterium]|nr:hypothetical protein [Kiritimatiellota bacterium]
LWKSVGNEVRGCSVRARAYMPAKGGIETSMIRNAWTKHKDKCGIEPILCGMDTDMAFLPGREAAMAVWDSLCWGGYPTEDALEKLPPSTRWNLFADNMIIKCPVGIMIGKAVERTIISKNVYLDCAEPVLDLGRDTVIMDDFVKNPAE